jgi:hypothetical protein
VIIASTTSQNWDEAEKILVQAIDYGERGSKQKFSIGSFESQKYSIQSKLLQMSLQ